MKIATFNIRCDYGQDGPNNFSCRQPLILRRLAAEQPDIIGFQEVLPHVQRWLRTALPGYTVLGCGRSRDYADEAVTLAVHGRSPVAGHLLAVAHPASARVPVSGAEHLPPHLRGGGDLPAGMGNPHPGVQHPSGP